MIDFFTSKRFYFIGWILCVLLLIVGIPIVIFLPSPGGVSWGLVMRMGIVSILVGGWFLWNYRKECSKEVLRERLGHEMEVEMEDTTEKGLARVRVVQRDLIEELREEGFKKYGLYMTERGRRAIMGTGYVELTDARKQRILKAVDEKPGASIRTIIDTAWALRKESPNMYDIAELIRDGLLEKVERKHGLFITDKGRRAVAHSGELGVLSERDIRILKVVESSPGIATERVIEETDTDTCDIDALVDVGILEKTELLRGES